MHPGYNADSSGNIINSEKPITSSAAITPSDSTVLTPGRILNIVCTVAGNVTVKFSDATTFTFAVAVGETQRPYGIKYLMATGTTATATYANQR
jgi:hypothetical protein